MEHVDSDADQFVKEKQDSQYGSVRPTQQDEDRQLIQGTSYEDAVEATDYGKFHYLLLAICGWALSSDAIEVLSISFILPPATEELQLTSADKGWLTAIIFVGMMIGGYLWGSLADVNGRRRILLISLTINGLGGLGSSFAQDFSLFFFLRFMSGIGVGGSLPVIFAYYMEFQPRGKRGSMISLLATFWMSGSIICAGLAWIIIPHINIGMVSPGFTYTSWRLFLAVCTAPAISSAFFFFLMPESPRYLLNDGRNDSALLVLKRMFKLNNPGQSASNYPVKQLLIPNIVKHYDTHPPARGSCGGACSKLTEGVQELFTRTTELFTAPYLRITIIMVTIYFTLSFGYYGLFMWFPELIAHMLKTGGSPCSLADIKINQTVNQTGDPDYNPNIYLESFITNLSNLPGNILTVLIIDRIRNGRNILLAISMVISGLCVFFIALLKTQTQSLIMSCIFSSISVIGWTALDVIGVEIWPTHLRSTATGFEMGFGRIASILANVIFGELVNIYCLVPMIMVAVFMTLGGLSALLLPNMAGQDTDRPNASSVTS